MARHIMSIQECRKLHPECEYGEKPCPVGKCPTIPDNELPKGCLNCPTHCPCCGGALGDYCDRCPEQDCANRNKPYVPPPKKN